MSDDAAECLECLLALVVGQSQPEPAQWWSRLQLGPARGGHARLMIVARGASMM